MEEERIKFVSSDQSSKVLEPTDRPLNLPSSSISPKSTTVLFGGANTPTAMRANQFDVSLGQPITQLVAVGGFVVDKLVGNVICVGLIEQLLDEIDLCAVGRFYIDGERQTVAIGEDHDLGTLATFGLSDEVAPFFAEANVPSANPSFQLILPFWSNASSNRRKATSQISSQDHSAKRRQQVAYDGNRGGKSLHRAPLISEL